MAEALPRVDITEMYGRLNAWLIDLVESIPDRKLEWSPREDLWTFRHILAHVAFSRHNWMGNFLTQEVQARSGRYSRRSKAPRLGPGLPRGMARVS